MNFEQIKEDLELFGEWEDRYGYIIDLGKQISLPDEKKIDLLIDKTNCSKVLV